MKKISITLVGILLLLIVGVSYINKSKDRKKEKEIGKNLSLEDYSTNIYEKIKLHWGAMYKVWPGLNYENHNLLLFKLDNNGEIEKAWLMNTKEKREISKEESEGIEAPIVFGYSKIEFQGKPSIIMSLDDSVLKIEEFSYESLYAMVTHELVHFYYQPDSLLKEEGNRSTEYPLDYKSRLYRKMIFLNLYKAFETEDKEKEEYLSRAKYWLQKWKIEYEGEYKAIQNTDIIEGSAKYIEFLGTIIKKKMAPKELKENIKKKLPTEIYSLAADGESYDLGCIGGVLLDISRPDWKNKYYDNSKSPVDILLDGVKPIKEDVNGKEEKKIKELVKENNREIILEIEDIIKAQENIKIPYLKIRATYMTGSFETKGFYNYKNQRISSSMNCIFKINNQKVILKDSSVINLNEANKEYILIPLLTGYNENKDILEINNLKINGSVIVKKIVENNGRVVFLVD